MAIQMALPRNFNSQRLRLILIQVSTMQAKTLRQNLFLSYCLAQVQRRLQYLTRTNISIIQQGSLNNLNASLQSQIKYKYSKMPHVLSYHHHPISQKKRVKYIILLLNKSAYLFHMIMSCIYFLVEIKLTFYLHLPLKSYQFFYFCWVGKRSELQTLQKSSYLCVQHSIRKEGYAHSMMLIDCVILSILIFSDGLDLKSRVHFFSVFVDRLVSMGFMKVNQSMLGVGQDLFQQLSWRKKSLGNLLLEATRTKLLFFSLDWLAPRFSNYLSLPSNIQKIIILAIDFRTISRQQF